MKGIQTKKWLLHAIFGVLLVLGVVVRLIYLPVLYEVYDGDTARDYMIARHIVRYHEFPTTGPNNAIYDAVRASPLYYYILAVPVAVYDSVYSIGVLNILLQAVSMVAVYALAFLLFGQFTASVCAFLLLGNQELFTQSFYMIQAHVGQMLFNLSYAALAYGYTKRSSRAVCIASILFTLGCSVAFHGFPGLFGFIIITLLILKAISAKHRYMYTIVGTMLIIGIFFYAPIILRVIHTHQSFFLLNEPVYIQSLTSFPLRVLTNIRLAIDEWVRNQWTSYSTKTILLSSFGILLIVHIWQKGFKQAKFVTVISLYILQITILAALLRSQTHSYQYDAAVGLTLVILTYIATHVWPKNILGHLGKGISIYVLILLTYPSRDYVPWLQYRMQNAHAYESKITHIYTYIDSLQALYPTDWNRRFQIVVYDGVTTMYHWRESIFWNALEHHYQRQFITVSNEGYNYTTPEMNDQHFLLVCEHYMSLPDAQVRCLKEFNDEHPLGTISRVVYEAPPYDYVLLEVRLNSKKP